MKKKDHITAFYLEALLLIAVFVGVIMLLTSVFAQARLESSRAKQLSDAVTLAQKGAEAFAASESPEELFGLLNDEGNGAEIDGAQYPSYAFCYDSGLEPDPEGFYSMIICWRPEGDGYIGSRIEVYGSGSKDSIYTLETGVYVEKLRTKGGFVTILTSEEAK